MASTKEVGITQQAEDRRKWRALQYMVSAASGAHASRKTSKANFYMQYNAFVSTIEIFVVVVFLMG